MDLNDKTDVLLNELKEDSGRYENLETDGLNVWAKKDVIRSLVNIRMPRSVPAKLLELEDDYLQEELSVKGIVSLSDIPVLADKVSLWQGDITRLEVGAIVNAANSQMLGCFVPCHKCIDNAIHSAAGMRLRFAAFQRENFIFQTMRRRRLPGRRYVNFCGRTQNVWSA